MRLIRLENYDIKFEEELLLLQPFNKLFKADKTKDKSNFLEFLSILYFTFDLRSEYQYIVDEDERLKEVCTSNGYKVPKFTKEQLACIALYKKLQNTTSSLLLEDTRATIDKIRRVLRDTEFDDLDEKDKVNALKTVAGTVAMMPKLIRDLAEVEKAVTSEIQESSRVRGSSEKTLMDDGIFL